MQITCRSVLYELPLLILHSSVNHDSTEHSQQLSSLWRPRVVAAAVALDERVGLWAPRDAVVSGEEQEL